MREWLKMTNAETEALDAVGERFGFHVDPPDSGEYLAELAVAVIAAVPRLRAAPASPEVPNDSR